MAHETIQRDDVNGRGRSSRVVSVLLGFAGLLLLAAAFSRGKGPLPPVVRTQPLAALACLAVGMSLALAPRAERLRHLVGRLLFGSRLAVFNAVVFAVGTGIHAATAWAAFDGLPRLDDAVAAIFQARIFASGALTLPLPPAPHFFECFGVLGGWAGVGHWCTMYPPGWSLLLVPGVLCGAPWLVNPVLGGLLVVALSALARELFGDRVGRLAAIMALFSPYLAVVCGSHLSHTATALFLTTCAWALVKLMESGRAVHGLVVGGAWGMAFLCRPLTTVAIGAAIGLWVPARWRGIPRAFRGLCLAVLLALAAGGALATWQYVTTGNPRTPGHTIGMHRGKYGFVRLDHARTHTVELGLDFTRKRMRVLNDQLLGWPVPAMLIVLFALYSGRGRGREWWLAGPWLAALAVYCPYWYWETYLPARYTFSAVPALLVLAARSYAQLEDALARRGLRWAHAARGLFAAGCLSAAAVHWPYIVRGFGPNHGDVESALPKVMARYDVHNAVVFIDAVGRSWNTGDNMNDFYATGFMRNTLDLAGDVVFARDSDGGNLELMDVYPDRRYFLYVYVRGTSEGDLFELRRKGDRYDVIAMDDGRIIPVDA